MRSMQVTFAALLLALGTACSDGDVDTPTDDAAAAPAQDAGQSAAANAGRTQAAPVTKRAIGPRGAVIDGPLAGDSGFQMPSPGVGPSAAAGATALDADTVRLALAKGIPGSGGDIQVQVTPRGIVSLSGEVASVAERQRAHYLARALPGVAEVDFENLRVR